MWFGSHWGFQWDQHEQRADVLLNANGSQIYPGDPFIFPANSVSLVLVPHEKLIFIRGDGISNAACSLNKTGEEPVLDSIRAFAGISRGPLIAYCRKPTT